MKILLLSLLLAACARVPEVSSPVTMEDVNAATASPGAPLWFVVILVSVMFLALLALPGSR